jgi:hypothetical protein
MHLVQDMSVPEHARDDGHYIDAYEEWIKDKAQNLVNAALANPIFFYFSDLQKTPSQFKSSDFANPGSFPIPAVPIANLFDTRQYYKGQGKNPDITIVPVSTPSGTFYTIGLAEYTNAAKCALTRASSPAIC